MKYPKRSQYKHAESQYRVRNWPAYEDGLQKRGDLTVWLSDEALDAWHETPSGKPGGQRTYADLAIEAALTIRMVFHLPLRQTEGFLRSLAELLEVDLPIPDHTTLSRRLKRLRDIRPRRLPTDRPIHLLIDSTGLQPSDALRERNRNIRSIRELGRRTWHTSSGYSKRSLVENTMYRYKTIIGRRMRSRTLDGQRVEVQLASKILNTMTHLGMPDSYRVA